MRVCSKIIGKIKMEHHNPVIVCAGNYNYFEVSTILEDYPDIQIYHTPPTRGNSYLDLTLTNITDEITHAEVLPPLTND